MKTYVCTICGHEREVMVNHDQLPVLYERCTDACSWAAPLGPIILSSKGEVTGFRRTLHLRKHKPKLSFIEKLHRYMRGERYV